MGQRHVRNICQTDKLVGSCTQRTRCETKNGRPFIIPKRLQLQRLLCLWIWTKPYVAQTNPSLRKNSRQPVAHCPLLTSVSSDDTVRRGVFAGTFRQMRPAWRPVSSCFIRRIPVITPFIIAARWCHPHLYASMMPRTCLLEIGRRAVPQAMPL